MSAVERLADPAARQRRMIAIASGKGGVGKTFLSVTLAHALANRGERVLLFDGDLGLANVDIQLGLTPQRDLGSVLDGIVPLVGAAEAYRPGGFDIVAGRSGTGSLATIAPHRAAELGDELRRAADGYDRVLLDLGGGIGRGVRQLAVRADTVLVVTMDEPTALTDAYAFLKVIHGAAPGVDLRIVVNKAASRRDGQRTYEALLKACQTFLGRAPALAGIVVHDRSVRDAIRAQCPLLTRSPHADAARDVERIADQICEEA